MPVLDGWGFLDAYIKIKDDLSKQPIIYICTSSIDIEDKTKAKQYKEVFGFFSKPITQDILLEVLKNY